MKRGMRLESNVDTHSKGKGEGYEQLHYCCMYNVHGLSLGNGYKSGSVIAGQTGQLAVALRTTLEWGH